MTKSKTTKFCFLPLQLCAYNHPFLTNFKVCSIFRKKKKLLQETGRVKGLQCTPLPCWRKLTKGTQRAKVQKDNAFERRINYLHFPKKKDYFPPPHAGEAPHLGRTEGLDWGESLDNLLPGVLWKKGKCRNSLVHINLCTLRLWSKWVVSGDLQFLRISAWDGLGQRTIALACEHWLIWWLGMRA